MIRSPIAGTILAGGRSSRMAGCDKARAPLAGKPLLQHVVDRVGPQVDRLALSVAACSESLQEFGLPQLPDPLPGHQGPLGGLLSALRHFAGSHEWLLLVPCDAPFLPLDLVARLHDRAKAVDAPCAVSVYRAELQPTFSLWHRRVLAELARAVTDDGRAGLKSFLRRIGNVECGWPNSQPPPFFNVNDEAALQQADRWVRQAARRVAAC